LVASPHELGSLRSRLGSEVKIVTPGVRPAWSAADDQKRFTTPLEAVQRGADYLVIGARHAIARRRSGAQDRRRDRRARAPMFDALHVTPKAKRTRPR
jgi:orotidine-5'-phosphate decarboxylase